MSTRLRRPALWLTGIVTIGFILLFSLHLLLTRAITTESFKKKLLEKVCATVDCQLSFEELEIRFLPVPHIAVSRVQITLPGTLAGTVETLAVVPKILPLLSGRVEPAELRLTAPRMEITIPEVSTPLPPVEAPPTASDTHSGQSGSPAVVKEELPLLSSPYLEAGLLSLINALSEMVPGLQVQVERGSFRINRRGRPLVSLGEVSAKASLPPGILAVRFECQSDFWRRLAVDGWVDPVKSTGSGQLSLDHFQSRLLGDYLATGTPKPVGDSPFNLDIAFSIQESGLLEASFQASSPSLTLQQGGQQAVINRTSLKGTLEMQPGVIDLRIDRLQAADPQLELTGRFRSHPESFEASYQVECRNTNATAVREVALALVGDSEEVQDVFTFVRGGQIPLATFEARGRSMTDLREARKLVVKGRLEDGEVFIPKIGLAIGEVFGDVLISNGILEGTNLQGKAGRSLGRQGSLTVALTKKDGPFHLDIEVDADLAELPPVLARVVDNQPFLQEMALVREVTGKARGRLILGDTLDTIKTRVEVGDWKLQGLYDRLPFPLLLEAKGLLFEGRELSVEALQAQIGRSEVHDLTGSLTWNREPALELTAPAKGHLLLDELFPWLLTFAPVRDNRWQIETLEGVLRMDSVNFKGPLTKPDSRQFALTGLLQKVTASSRLLGNPLKIGSGVLTCSHQHLEATKWDLTFLDASLAVSGRLTGFLAEERPSVDFTFQGLLGPQAAAWLSDVVEMPGELRVATPLSFLPSRFTLDPSGRLTLSSVFRAGDSADLTVELERGSRELVLKQLKVEDQESNATITLNRQPTEVGFGFQGNLLGATLDRLLVSNNFFKGSMTGNFSVQLHNDRLPDSRAEGALSLRDFRYAPVPGKTLRVDEASLEAGDHALELKSASIRLQDLPLNLNGIIRVGQNQLLLDLDLQARGIDWSQLQAGDLLQSLENSAFGEATAEGMTFFGIPIRGVLRIQADHFGFAGYTWKPFGAALTFASDGLNLDVTRANLCAIPTPARLVPHPQGSVLIVNPDASNLDLDATLGCLFDRRRNFTGTFDLDGEITATVQPEKMTETLRGNLNLKARDGRVYHSPVLSKIFTLLNVTEIYRGRLPDLMQEGCAYDAVNARATLMNGKVLIEDAVFDGHCAKMVWTGEIDLATLKVDFTVLVSPFKTVDTVIRNIPLLGSILGGTLVTIPVQVVGDISDPSVVALPPTAVGSGLLNTMKKVLQLPFTLIQPLR